MNKTIKFSGIHRNIPQDSTPDGSCQEIINMRYRKGAWRPRKSKVHMSGATFSYLGSLIYFKHIFLHDIEGGLISGKPNWIGYKPFDIASSTLSGTVTVVTPNQTGIKQVEKITLTGTNGKAMIMIGGIPTEVTFNTSLTQTAADFVAAWNGSISDVVLSSVDDDIFFTAEVAGSGFNSPTIENITSVCGLFQINPTTKTCTLIQAGITDTIDVQVTVVFLKRTMIVTTGAGLLVFLYADSVYSKLGTLPVPQVDLTSTIYYDPAIAPSGGTDRTKAHATVISEYAHDSVAVVGNYYAAINNQSANASRVYGSIMYIVAYRLFDGSFIMQSLPRYHEVSNGGFLRHQNPDKQGWDNASWAWVLCMGTISASINANDYPSASFGNMSDIVDSVAVFATKMTPIFKIDTTTVTDVLLTNEKYGGSVTWVDRNFNTEFPLNSPDFEDICASSGWYKIVDIPFSDIVGKSGLITKEADTKGFYQDYATRKTLPTDQFSHHGLVAKTSYIYNDRLHIGSVKTIFGNPELFWPEVTGYTKVVNTNAVIVVHLSTSLGKVVKVYECLIPSYRENNTSQYYYCQPAIVGYPDSRATKIEVAAQSQLGGHVILFSCDLKKNVGLNLSYYHRTSFSITQGAFNNYNPLMILVSLHIIPYLIPTEKTTPFDTNRIQVSEIQNPLFYPAINSYQVGTGEIIAMASGSEPLSAGQFGSFPLQVFTTKGRWALQQGSGDILYQSVQNIDGEVADNPMNVFSMGSGVLYSTEKGLFVGIGQQSTKLSEPAEGSPHLLFNSKTEVVKLLNDDRFTPELKHSLSDEDFLDYLHDSSVGYDQLNKEVIVTKAGSGYSYVYSIENKNWHKISQSFDLLINNYPTLLGIYGPVIYDLSRDEITGTTSVMVVTNALSLELLGSYKKIERMIVRAFNSTASGSVLGIYLFGTDDLVNYQFLTGKQRTGEGLKDLIVQRSPGSCKYYVIVYNGVITQESTLSSVDIMFIERLGNKMR